MLSGTRLRSDTLELVRKARIDVNESFETFSHHDTYKCAPMLYLLALSFPIRSIRRDPRFSANSSCVLSITHTFRTRKVDCLRLSNIVLSDTRTA